MALSAIATLALTRYPIWPSSYFSSPFSHNITRFLVNRHTPKQSWKTMASASSTHDKVTAPYGSWKSPITADVVSGAEKRLGGTAVDELGRLFWLESRPAESGRSVLVKAPEKPGDEPVDITPKEFSVRTVTQEYGGGAFKIVGDTVIFSNYKDQRLYKQLIESRDSFPLPLTPDYGGPLVSYADGEFDSHFNRYVTVREDGREDHLNSTTTIVSIDLNDQNIQEPEVLIGGNDFYAFPRLDPKGGRIAWIEWGHPNMPWDKSELWVGYFSENGHICKRICVAGGDPALVESPTEPKWSSKGELLFITDRRSGFWNIYKWIESDNKVLPVYSLDAEFSRPLWVFGLNSYQLLQSHEQKSLIACTYRQNGRSSFGILDDVHSTLSLLDLPFTDINNIISGLHCLYIEGASAVHPLSIAKVTLDDHKSKVIGFEIIWSSSPDSSKYKSYYSLPELVEFPTEVPGQNAYAYFYPPTNPIYQASQEEKPPLLLRSHGGPTAETRGVLNLTYQYWTSRGWAVVDVNYGGSTGYGREYRERLLGSWGIVDVNDCCSCATFLVNKGKVDGERLCIVGGSAGGYTTLAALAFRETFKAGASLYGIADLTLMRAETHKFESHYLDNLVGNEDDYFQRSPINFVNKFSCPILLLQGLEDKVVPPNQARKIYHALTEKGLPVALVEFEGEQHGFRKAETIKFALEQQMMFFARLVGHFKVADEITPIRIDNFD
ncbi:Dipeptidyl aminopeptidase [Actinidia chinensis var. chinensis]|uniref:Dipeptidyl aminopeptidase n=1 Tax=Actinidia chinensis var. chinensis TaxID=1590841 RepID=A0A2R6Q034_ACTCC|nr:Dipeptidyl aminopeptidase [Actinidia chinensis var. chinensis]